MRSRWPRLSRKQRIVRNLLLGWLLLFVGWGVQRFQAPTADCALRWRLESYGMEHAEILYEGPGEEPKERTTVLRSGDFYGVAITQKDGLWGYTTSELRLEEAEAPVTFLSAPGYVLGGDRMYYAAADVPDAVRAVCTVRLRGKSDASITVEGERTTSGSYDWDEVYRSETPATGKGIWPFQLKRKYPNDPSTPYSEQTLQLAERSMFLDFRSIFGGSADPDFSCRLRIQFFDGEGKELAAYEKTLGKDAAQGT